MSTELDGDGPVPAQGEFPLVAVTREMEAGVAAGHGVVPAKDVTEDSVPDQSRPGVSHHGCSKFTVTAHPHADLDNDPEVEIELELEQSHATAASDYMYYYYTVPTPGMATS